MNNRLRMPFELKSLGDRQFEGYGAVFKNVDYGGDVILPGAFKNSLAEMNQLPPMFWMHQSDQIPGKWLDMKEDRYGLKVVGELADTQLGRETHTLLKMEAVRGMSIGYATIKSDFANDGTRVLKELELVETSIVSLPMNPLANITAVKSRLSSAGEYVPTIKQMEQHFRDMGCSKSTARKLISMIYGSESGVTLDETDDDSGVTLELSAKKSGATPDIQSRCDADEEKDDATVLEDAVIDVSVLHALNEFIIADQFKHKLARGFS